MICPNCQHDNRETAKFCDNCGHKLDNTGRTEEGKPSFQAPISRFISRELADKLELARAGRLMEGERRIVTMLFCDVKGSTAAAESLDPEEWAEIMNGIFDYMIPPIFRYEGIVARLMGDAMLAFFGAPIAHEDDPLRAVLAGLEIVSEIKPYREKIRKQWGFDFDVRVGINTGLVMVGAVGSDLRMEYTAMGDAINLAARMEQTAAPGTVQISRETYQHVSPFFEFEPLGGVQVKGKQEPIQTYRPLDRKAAPGSARGIEGLAVPLIGRARERSQLETALTDLEKGVGGIVYIIGEAGLGKSRLIQEIRTTELEPGPAPRPAWYETLSYSYESEQPYGLFRRLIRRMTGMLSNEKNTVLRSRIQQLVEEAPHEERPTGKRVLESLFGLTGTAGEPPLEGETFKGLLFTTMDSLWQRRAQASPMVLVCDDLHWSDPASLALLQHLFPLAERVPLLFLCALRSEPDTPGWEAMQAAEDAFSDHFQKIQLGPLETSESGELVDNLLAISDLPVGLRDKILEKSEGNPFFVEEVVRSLIDQGVVVREEDGGRWQATGKGEDLVIPGNLQTLLVSRMDRLPEQTRWTLQAASVVGRSFYHRILQRIVDFAVSELDQHLRTLQQADLILEASRFPELEYLFRHALTQEAAYSTILLRHRREHHRRVGEVLETLFPDQLEEIAGNLADHYFRASDFEKSLHYSIRAGDSAFRMYALREAIEHYLRAIECAGRVEAGSERLIHIYSKVGRAYEHNHQFQFALDTYLELEHLADEIGDQQMRLTSLTAQCILQATHNPVYNQNKARELAQNALVLARKLGNQASEARALWGMMLVEYSSGGGFNQALEYGLQSLSIAKEMELMEQMGYVWSSLAWMYLAHGQFEMGEQTNQENQAVWEQLGNLPMLADAYTLKLALQWLTGKFESGLETAAETLRLSRSIGNRWNQFEAQRMMGVFYRLQGRFDQALKRLEAIKINPKNDVMSFQGYAASLIDLYMSAGALEEANHLADILYSVQDDFMPVLAPFYLTTIARVKIARGEIQESRKLLDQAWERFNPEGAMAILRSKLFVVEGHLNLALGNPEKVIESMEENVRIGRDKSLYLYLPQSLLLLGKAKRVLGNDIQARRAFQEAKEEAEGTGERVLLWQILAHLADTERTLGNQTEADKLIDQAENIIGYIADHSPPELRARFLAQSEVRAITDRRMH